MSKPCTDIDFNHPTVFLFTDNGSQMSIATRCKAAQPMVFLNIFSIITFKCSIKTTKIRNYNSKDVIRLNNSQNCRRSCKVKLTREGHHVLNIVVDLV